MKVNWIKFVEKQKSYAIFFKVTKTKIKFEKFLKLI